MKQTRTCDCRSPCTRRLRPTLGFPVGKVGIGHRKIASSYPAETFGVGEGRQNGRFGASKRVTKRPPECPRHPLDFRATQPGPPPRQNRPKKPAGEARGQARRAGSARGGIGHAPCPARRARHMAGPVPRLRARYARSHGRALTGYFPA